MPRRVKYYCRDCKDVKKMTFKETAEVTASWDVDRQTWVHEDVQEDVKGPFCIDCGDVVQEVGVD